MTSPALAAYTFLPWVQGGVSRSIAGRRTSPPPTLAARVTLPVSVHLDGAGDVPATVRLYGPGDVTGLERRADRPPRPARRAPPASRPATCRRSSSRAPTSRGCSRPPRPARPDAAAAVARAGGGPPRRRRRRLKPGSPLPVLELDAARPRSCPDLAQSWAWAHAQITGLAAGARPADVLAADPGRACSRLVCARKLRARHRLPGLPRARVRRRRRGRARRSPCPTTRSWRPAWGATPTGPLRLPVYDSWEFATGPAGSFETLVRKLHPAPLDPTVGAAAEPRPGRGRQRPAGRRAWSASRARCACPARTTRRRGRTRRGCRSRRRSSALLGTTAPDDAGAAGVRPGPGRRERHSRRPATEPDWLRELNLDPRLRVAAAAGTRVVQDRQEQLMARAWEQAGAAAEANARAARLAARARARRRGAWSATSRRSPRRSCWP